MISGLPSCGLSQEKPSKTPLVTSVTGVTRKAGRFLVSPQRPKKDVMGERGARVTKTKNQKLPPKKAPEMLAGYVEARMVKCGKAGCKCERGELHGPYFYHFTWIGGRRFKSYVRRADVAERRAACEAYRQLQRELLAGRREWQRTLNRARELFKMLSGAERAGWL